MVKRKGRDEDKGDLPSKKQKTRGKVEICILYIVLPMEDASFDVMNHTQMFLADGNAVNDHVESEQKTQTQAEMAQKNGKN